MLWRDISALKLQARENIGDIFLEKDYRVELRAIRWFPYALK